MHSCKGTKEQLDILIFTLCKMKMTLKNFTCFSVFLMKTFYSIFIEQKYNVFVSPDLRRINMYPIVNIWSFFNYLWYQGMNLSSK